MVRQVERGFAAALALVFLGFGLGCMSLSIGGKSEVVSHDDVAGLERGNVHIGPGQEQTVYYPAPYMSPPNLEFEDTAVTAKCQIVEQRPDGFRVRNMGATPVDISWKTRGVKATGTTLVSVPQPTSPAPPAVQQTGYVGPTHP
jgi:hypothetical protein